jgi:hypothetical protein
MNGEGWGRRVKELVGMIVREYDPQIRLKCAQALADVGSNFTHARDDCFVFGVRHGEELGCMGQHRATDHGRPHGQSPVPQKFHAGRTMKR